jgi:photosystem II stability/assembly factor-like uncharacterized protein
MTRQRSHDRNYAGLVLILVVLVSWIALRLALPTAASIRQRSSGSIFSGPHQENPQSLNRWSRHGPEGGSVRSLAIARSNPATIYAGVDGSGVFKSTNGGESWSSSLAITDGNTYVRALAIDPTTATTVYAAREGSDAGIFKSSDGGISWRSTTNLDVATLAIDPVNPNIIYGGLHEVFKTTDGGGSWMEIGIKNGMSPETTLLTLAIDPTNPNIIYAPADIHGADVMYQSTNGGGVMDHYRQPQRRPS